MNKRSIPVLIVSCILAAAGILGYRQSVPVEANPTRILMENSGGRVVFFHLNHSTPGGAYGDIACAACHHELNIEGAAASATQNGATLPAVIPCKSCHGAVDNPSFIDAHQELYRAQGGEATCISCHHKRTDGLTTGWNHEEHVNYAGEDCATCHHPLEGDPKADDPAQAKRAKCSSCHSAKASPKNGVTLKTAAHTRCQPCHEELFDGGKEGCLTCHKIVSTSEELAKGKRLVRYDACSNCHAAMPGNMDAYHGNCMSCHDKVGKGPGAKAPCAQCHTP